VATSIISTVIALRSITCRQHSEEPFVICLRLLVDELVEVMTMYVMWELDTLWLMLAAYCELRVPSD